jgi:ribosomal-protein-alanine N-acetyltransferase
MTEPRSRTQVVAEANPESGAGYCKPPHVRWMIAKDLWQVLWIDDDYSLNPWSEKELRAILRERDTIGMVAEDREFVRGFVVYRLHSDRLELLRFGSDLGFGSAAVERALIATLMAKLSPQRRTRIEVAVGERDLKSQLFFRSAGFRATRTLRGHMASGDDAYRMTYELKQEEIQS